MLKLNKNEMIVIMEISKPSNFNKLYKKIKEIEELDSQVDSSLENTNYSKINQIYSKKKSIKSMLIKNQLSLLVIYQQVIDAKADQDNIYNLDLNYTLASILLNFLVIESLILERKAKKEALSSIDKTKLVIIDEIIRKMSIEYEAERILNVYNNIDIINFKGRLI